MRVLHITSGNLYGGVEVFLATLVREASAAPGMEPDVAVCFEGRFSAELESMGRAPHVLPSPRLSRPNTVLNARHALRDLLQRESYDVVVCHQPWACVMFASVVRRAGFPVVMWMHMAGDGKHWLERLCRLSRPDLAVCNSRFTADRTSAWLPRTSIEHAYCPVSTSKASLGAEERSVLRRSLQTPADDVVVVQVSRLEAFKGQYLLLEALATLRDLPRWTCWLVGGAQRPIELEYLQRLQAIARDCGIADRIRFTGERGDVGHLLRAADVYCQPNTEPEGFGLSFIEAMGAGLPVVTSGIGGAREVVNELCGTLVQPGDVNELSQTIRRLVLDAGLRERLAAEARIRASELCDPVQQMRRIQALLSGVVVNGPRLERAHAVNVK